MNNLNAVAQKIANDVAQLINEIAPQVETKTPYKNQELLETVIQKLQEKV